FNPREVGYAETFYPGVPDMASATQIDLAPGQQAEADFSVKPQPVFQVSGEVAGNGVDQGGNLQFINSLGDKMQVPVRFDPEDGKFQARLPGGNYVLKAQVYGEGAPLTASLPVAINSDLSGVRLALEPALSIPVVVRTEPGVARRDVSQTG